MLRSTNNLTQQKEQKNFYGGISRIVYFLGMLGISVVLVLIKESIQTNLIIDWGLEIIWLVLAIALSVNRMRNIGMNVWWSLLLLVPLVNFVLFVICVIRQEGYMETKILDTTGKIILVIVLAMSLLVVAVSLIINRQYFFGMT